MQKSILIPKPVVIGIDIGGTKISAALFDFDGNLQLRFYDLPITAKILTEIG